VTLYDASVAVHVGAAVLGFGPTFAYPVIQLAAERRDRTALPFAIGAILRISRTLAVPMAVVVGLTGAYQVVEGPWSLRRDEWLVAGIALYVAVFAVAVGYLTPALRRAQAEAERMLAAAPPGGPPALTAEYRRSTRGLRLAGGVVGAAVLALIALMELKPLAG
jgi:uncharacterized membrane protein